MNRLIANIQAWFLSKNITTHTLAAFAIVAAGIIAFDPQAQTFVKQVCGAHAALATEIITLCLIVAKYSPSRSDAGVVAASKAIMANGNAPTAAQVDAATTH